MDEQNLNEQELPLEEQEMTLDETTPEISAPEVSDTPDPNEIDDTKPLVPKPRRRKSKQQMFKEQYLPFLILGLTGVLCLSFVFGSLGMARRRAEQEAQQARIEALLQEEAGELKTRAAAMAAEYDYENAMKTLASYSGGLAGHSELLALYNGYKEALDSMVAWDDLSKVPNLSFRTLVADYQKAVADADRGSRYKKNYVTTDEFSRILNQLYDNGYVLVSITDFAAPVTGEDGSVAIKRTGIRLPEGKKPIVLTQEGVNYYSHMERCGGFADSLVVNEGGELTCRMGENEGDFDLVPILNSFLAEHPDFSYEDARATIAVSGYEGLFGMGLEEADAIRAVADKLRAQGYDLACYTYADMKYADYGASGLQEDLDKWFAQITPVLGETDLLVYPTGGDIKGKENYSGSKYDALHSRGFRYFVGTGSGECWGMTAPEYVRHTRTVVTAANLANHPEWFAGMFDAATVLSAERG